MKKIAAILHLFCLLSMSESRADSDDKRTQPQKESCKERIPVCMTLPGKENRPAFSLDLSFLYYWVGEDGLDLANSAAVVTSGNSAGDVIAIDGSRCLTQRFEYGPGFKVGMAASWEKWSLKGEYTWFSQTTHQSKKAPTVDPLLGSGVWVLNDWFQQTSTSGQPIGGTEASSKWHIGINLVDLVVKRLINKGCSLFLIPSFGMRGSFIHQHLDVKIDVSPSIISNLATPQSKSHNSSHSWGLGPIAGCDFYWFLPMNFNVEGGVRGALLFTQFTTVKHRENVASASSQPNELSVKLRNINCVRPQLDLFLGLGWGTYVEKGKYYLDFAATYNFLLFWQQNMMRKLMDQTVQGIGAAAGDLYMHGLEVRSSLYF